jgi:site-specific recombinase XerC
VPRSEVVLSSLRREFGDRLVEEGGGACVGADYAAAASAAPEGEDAGVATDPRNRVVESGPAEGAGEVAASVLVAELRRVARLREYSRKTEKAYVSWVERYFRWASAAVGAAPGTAAAGAMDEATLVAFLEHLGHEGLAARSRNQAVSALNFLLRQVLRRNDVELPRARGPVRMAVVLTHREVMRLLGELKGKYLLIGMLLYSSGLRIGECLSLRIKDLDFELRQILVRDGKGRKDRYVPLAARAAGPLRAQVQRVVEQQRRELAAGHGWARCRARCTGKTRAPATSPAGSSCSRRAASTQPRNRPHRPLAAARHCRRARVQGRSSPLRHPEARDVPHAPPLVRNGNTARWLRHPHAAAGHGTPRHPDDHDLPARRATDWAPHPQSARPSP